ncbi:hypothetical protein J2792_000320 [Novosphingobium capsulatum]|uniref:Holin of 3TMs, for gene-transfer release n=1 Tax=Novosphingobium capsulatum TaxID=13688 RepID=A0ABU1MGL7_9SPHN|nr:MULTISPECIES: hypothetical protein [Novosphingobium]KPF52970.1 hypothetical protein IP65_15485 [Novosphingobium sp. AAP1]MBB3358483.1 hypothetical protein [Novosphingobium sp. BK256]MBB3374844.1 hypothetical protein [Novosphingobium sp. BK280]MBB3379467.1 hypothetical protein [Novosphingobium sp. BK258]MBB3421162.1 hypothetical protein [Novosphingobium sp. BK267]
MSAEETLLAAAQARAQAWQDMRSELVGLKDDLAARPLGQRLRDRLIDEMVEAIDGAGTVIKDTAPALIITLVVLAGWTLREPLTALGQWLWDKRPSGWFGKRENRKWGRKTGGLW